MRKNFSNSKRREEKTYCLLKYMLLKSLKDQWKVSKIVGEKRIKEK